MADAPHQRWTDIEAAAIREELTRILTSAPFQQSPRRQRFLEYVVHEALEGRIDRLKGYSIGVEIFEKPESFDPATDPIVRVEAGRLRDKLREYYETDGKSDVVRIDIPKGSYTPLIEIRSSSEAVPGSGANPAPQPSSGIEPHRPAADGPPYLALIKSPQNIAGAVGCVLILLMVGWNLLRPGVKPVASFAEKPSLAVLPFEIIGDDPTWRRLSDGMTQDITTDLSQSKDVLVIARTSTEVYRGKVADIRDIGRKLGVRYVLQGSIQPIDSRIRITAQLVDARSGENVWTTRYNRPAADLFDVQSTVTDSIAATLAGLEGAMAQAERRLIRRKPPSVLVAYDYFLLGVEAKHGGSSGGVTKEGLDEAERLFRKALELDPQLARAYVGLSYLCEYRLDLSYGVPAENLTHLVEYAKMAVTLDPDDAEAQMVLGHAFVYQGLPDKALEKFARAEMLAPSNADVLILIAWYLPQLDQSQRAVALVERALRLNPNYPSWYNQGLRYVYFFGGDFEKAVKYVKLVPNPNPLDFAFLASAEAMLKNDVAAASAAAELEKRDATWNVETYLSDNGPFPDASSAMFVEAARKAGVPTCAPAEYVAKNLAFSHIRSCDDERARFSAKALKHLGSTAP